MNYSLLLLSLFAFSACAQPRPVQKVTETIHPGEVRWVQFPVTNDTTKFICRDTELKFSRTGELGQTAVIESYFSNLSSFTCRAEDEDGVYHEIAFSVQDKEYHAEQLKVNPRTIKLSPKDQKRANKEQLMLNKIYASSLKELQFALPFIRPMESTVTSVYGVRRVYNNMKKGQHLGTDFRAAIGEKVPAANRGKVVFAGDLFYTGGTVIIDHGLDIFTVYGHLSKPMVKAGTIVERGQIIGLSGNTGRTSGPHLHWGVKVQGQYIDGFVLVDETKKYFTND